MLIKMPDEKTEEEKKEEEEEFKGIRTRGTGQGGGG